MWGQPKRFSVYDLMDAKGVFKSNPANAGATTQHGVPIYRGPVKYPRMMYHPTGEEQVVVPEKRDTNAFGHVTITPAVKEVKYILIYSAEEERQVVEAGWHFHPAAAIEAANDPKRPVPPRSSVARVVDLEDELARKTQELEEARAQLRSQGMGTAGASVSSLEARMNAAGMPQVHERSGYEDVGTGELDFSRLSATPSSSGPQTPFAHDPRSGQPATALDDAILTVQGKPPKNSAMSASKGNMLGATE